VIVLSFKVEATYNNSFQNPFSESGPFNLTLIVNKTSLKLLSLSLSLSRYQKKFGKDLSARVMESIPLEVLFGDVPISSGHAAGLDTAREQILVREHILVR